MNQKDLYEAIRLGAAERVRTLIDKQPELLTLSPNWLHDAAHYGHVEIVKLLLKSGQKLPASKPANCSSARNRRPLRSASEHRRLNFTRYSSRNGPRL